MTPELSAFLRRCRNPLFAAGAARVLARRAAWAVRGRLAPASRLRFPTDVAHARRTLLATDDEAPVAIASAPPATTLVLTGTRYTVQRSTDWEAAFPDDETTLSLHRWNWLLRGLTDTDQPLARGQGIALMRSWLGHAAVRDATRGDAYSTGERIANGVLFLLRTGDGSVPPDLGAHFRAMARDVAEHLEYLRSGETGNHAFNNARALLLGGLAADVPDAVALARVVIRERLPAVVDADGFMNEGSSHYHFLFTRWVLEMLWVARWAADTETAALLEPAAARLVERCWFFLVQGRADGAWRLPLMGDVSPDCPPDWLVALPWSAPALASFEPPSVPAAPRTHGWAALFGTSAGSGAHVPRSEAWPVGGWYRVERDGWTLFTRARPDDGRLRATHEHLDLGGLVLFRHGVPVLADPGRHDYTPSALGRYGWSAQAHTALLVDGRPAQSDGPTWMAPRFRAVHVGVTLHDEGDESVLHIRHDGFARLASGVGLHERIVRVGPSAVSIEDRLEGGGEHELALHVQFAPGATGAGDPADVWRAAGVTGIFEAEPGWSRATLDGRIAPPLGGIVFPEYARMEEGRTVIVSGRARLPAIVRHRLTETS